MSKFYDIHFHAMNMSHPNLLAFVQRLPISIRGAMLFAPLAAPFVSIKRIKNLLSVMENDIGSMLLMLEWFLRKREVVKNGKTLSVGGRDYDGIVLTPLMIDFGDKNTTVACFYNLPPEKPIIDQVNDLFNGIAVYASHDLNVTVDQATGKLKLEQQPVSDKRKKLFEIYPFLGLNTRNYTRQKLKELLDKYFGDLPADPQARRALLFEKFGTFQGNVDQMGVGYVAGVKVYPPLGFDPWPEPGDELDKVKDLYQYCVDHRIPITAHCSDGGFATAENPEELTSPDKWSRVLETYRTLTLNLAHLGAQKKKWKVIPRHTWRDQVLKLVANHPNVYSDFSCQALTPGYYDQLAAVVQGPQSAADRVLFGTDFMINLLWSEAYNEYLRLFIEADQLSPQLKHGFCSVNPERFLFG